MFGDKAVKFKFPLGIRAKDITCGFEGVITGRLQHLNGCIQYMITPNVDKDGERQDSWNIDEGQLVKVDNGIHKKTNKPAKEPTGGPATRA